MTTQISTVAAESPPVVRPGPWRITFDTNPDDCNLRCIMCEDHSPYSMTQPNRLSAGRPKRRMDVGLIRRVLADSEGTPLREIIPSTMGEPLLYREFDEILELCASACTPPPPRCHSSRPQPLRCTGWTRRWSVAEQE